MNPSTACEQVDLENATGDRVGFLREPAEGHDSRIVDKHVDRAELLLDGAEESAKRVRVGHIQRQRGSEAQVRARLHDHRRVDIPNGDDSARLRQTRSDRSADAPSTSGDNNHLAREGVLHCSRVSASMSEISIGHVSGYYSGQWSLSTLPARTERNPEQCPTVTLAPTTPERAW